MDTQSIHFGTLPVWKWNMDIGLNIVNLEEVAEVDDYTQDVATKADDAPEADIIEEGVPNLEQSETLVDTQAAEATQIATGHLNDQVAVKNVDAKDDNDENIKNMLEEKYKFRNDETSTRYRIANDGVQAKTDDPQIEWAFRSYAVRRIVGGMETSISMYPYNVAISRNGKHWCGGSIIDEQWVLTAGHCLESATDGDKKKLVPFIVRAGSSFHNRGGYQARVNKVFFPKTYVPGGADYDFSLLRLDRPMPIGRNIAVLNLPSKDYVMKEEDILIVTGWGSTDESGYGHIPDRVRFVPVPVMRLDACQKSYRFYITPRMLCAGYATGGKDACNHDSGGPAVRDGVLLGIVSFGGKQCGDPRSPGVYSRVSEITDWVEKTISNNEAENEPDLREKIQKARLRERELQKFKARVEDKKNQIKSWLRDTLKSPLFIQLAKQKLSHAGFGIRKNTRRNLRTELNKTHLMDDSTIDEINLSNQINEQILEAGEKDESEKLLRTLAVHEVVNSDGIEDLFSTNSSEIHKIEDSESDLDETIETLIAYITEK
ncbi:trypsin domain-containing protein [Phthorimaea operculella]|nr:trypsin domain-containing protein [Phthorimaea operculella]